MTQIVKLLNFEEGYVEKPYLDTLGFPTIAGGIRIGPKGAALSNYTFTVPREVGDVWKISIIDAKIKQMKANASINSALAACNDARSDILYSMAYQMGVPGLANFKNMIAAIAKKDFNLAATEMLDSLWARQTPGRAKRHAEVMRSGTYDTYRNLL